MNEPMEPSVLAVLERGDLCYLAADTRRGPHLTPTVFVLSDDRLWVTTSRSSVKARAWRSDPSVAGLVRAGDTAITFSGRVRTFDMFDVGSWPRDLMEAPALARASTRFTRKNARFFAGYAVDARHVPLTWTPPGRVFTAIEIERAALLGDRAVLERVGRWSRSVPSKDRFRTTRAGVAALDGLPREISDALGETGEAALAITGPRGPVVVPVRWAVSGPAVAVTVPRDVLGLAGLREPRVPAALAIDRASWWRAKAMTGAMVRGTAEVVDPDALVSGAASARRVAALTGAGEDAVLVWVLPEELVWWQGWSSGTVLVT